MGVALANGPVGAYVSEIAPRGPAACAGLFVGDIVESIAYQPAKTVEDVQSILLKNSQASVPICVRRGATMAFLAVALLAQER